MAVIQRRAASGGLSAIADLLVHCSANLNFFSCKNIYFKLLGVHRPPTVCTPSATFTVNKDEYKWRPCMCHLHLSFFIQLHSPEYTLAENININSNIQNKDRNMLINIVQLKIRYTFVKVLTKDIPEDALGKFPHEVRTPFLNFDHPACGCELLESRTVSEFSVVLVLLPNYWIRPEAFN